MQQTPPVGYVMVHGSSAGHILPVAYVTLKQDDVTESEGKDLNQL